MDHLSSLRTFMSANNLPIFTEITLDGKIHRYSSRHNNKKSEWYIGQEIKTGMFICTFASWHDSETHFTWRSYEQSEISNETELLEEINEEIKIHEEEIKKEQIKRAEALWTSAPTTLTHPYLSIKHIRPDNLKCFNELLLIPLYNITGQFQSLQRIASDGTKRFFTGIPVRGLMHIIGNIDPSEEIFICEGFATGYSIYEATGQPTICAMSAGNIITIAQMLKNKYPNKILKLAADNDEAGLKVVEKWKEYFNENIYLPKTPGFDFNDEANKNSLDAVKEILSPKRINEITLHDFINTEFKEITLINDIIQENSFNIIFGRGGTGKSMFSCEMGFCISLGQNYLNLKTHHKHSVLYIDGEMAASDIKKRFISIIERYAELDIEITKNDFSIINNENILSQINTDINLYNESHRMQLEQTILKYDVIFFDNYGCLTVPNPEDNYKLDKLEWINFFLWIKKLKMKYNKTIILIMHTNKSGNLEGISKIRNDADTVLEVKKPVDIATDCLIHFEISFDKARHLPIYKQQPIIAKLPKTMPFSNHGWVIETL